MSPVASRERSCGTSSLESFVHAVDPTGHSRTKGINFGDDGGRGWVGSCSCRFGRGSSDIRIERTVFPQFFRFGGDGGVQSIKLRVERRQLRKDLLRPLAIFLVTTRLGWMHGGNAIADQLSLIEQLKSFISSRPWPAAEPWPVSMGATEWKRLTSVPTRHPPDARAGVQRPIVILRSGAATAPSRATRA